jgi:uncharacterized membrane protein
LNLRIKPSSELAATVVLAGVLIAIIAILPSNLPRIILGLPFLLLSPGYSLTTALFPGKTDLRKSERLALSFGLSIAVVSLTGLLLNYTWGVRLWPLVTTLTILVLTMSTLAFFRRRRLPEADCWTLSLELDLPRWASLHRTDRVLYLMLALSLAAATGLLAYSLISPAPQQRLTEFYVLGLEGQAQDYPRNLSVGEEATVVLGIVNHEHQDTTYCVQIWIDKGAATEERCGEIESIALSHDEKWEQEASFAAQQAGQDRQVDFRLFKGGECEPYRTLHLPVNVVP